ncbi:MAG: YafY family transcriptional regulator [Actinomycetota bacterium]|nr:YafY family transcriptional regulator [Actinomycetota bacterium]
MAGTTSRALRLLSLLQARRTWSGSELMGRLEVSERTLRRDIDRLRDLGYPVRAVPGPAGGYQLEAGAEVPPLLLDDEEAVAIAMGLLTAAGGTIAGIEETSLRALAKLEKVLPPRIRQRVQMLQAAVVPMIRAWVTVDAEALTAVAQACRDRERLRFDYRTFDGTETERHVEPHQLVSSQQRWYLVAFDRDRDDWRTFRLDRLTSPRATRINFKPRAIPGGDAAEYVTRSLRARPMRYQVVADLRAPAAEITARLRFADGEVEFVDDTHCRFRTQGDALEWLTFILIWLDVDFEVQEPPELIDYLASVSRRLASSQSAIA